MPGFCKVGPVGKTAGILQFGGKCLVLRRLLTLGPWVDLVREEAQPSQQSVFAPRLKIRL